MPEKEPLTKDKVREYADHFLRWLDANPRKVPADNWHMWRVSLGNPCPVDRPNDERSIREFLVLKDCITNPQNPFNQLAKLGPNGRTALDFDGGPIAYWNHLAAKDDVDYKSNLAAIRSADAAEGAELRAIQSESGARTARRWAIVASVAAIASSSIKIADYIGQRTSNANESSDHRHSNPESNTPPIGDTASGKFAIPLPAAHDTVGDDSSSKRVLNP